MSLWTVAPLVFLLNLPFGYWRASTKKFSRRWMLAALLPVPPAVALIIYSGIGWKLISFPVLVGAFFLGQFVGGKVRLLISGKGPR
ncbi:MAG: hypothetical protein LC795_15925 [Acidobacteria bacterium]|nr:hypothetical protein [Acidobacteriota bacterium]